MNFNNHYGNMQEEYVDEFLWDEPEAMGSAVPPFKDFRNQRYHNAYGDYRGGYGPSGGFGPPRFGPRPGPPPLMMGRGFGPRGPPMRKFTIDDRAIRYLMRCGVAKEHLKNLPRDLLQLIEPEYCGLCAQSFDSFTISRMHYISKNHIKSQKKWLAQQSEMGAHRNREVPLKSRDLYCELCDVHITSKNHADSHYAGKPHRAIVDGRKNPKNPILLQRGMEDRVDQLIRREKRNLKPAEELEQSGDAAKDGKPVQSDLYCEICKTSVTCSEQMTMHLNGKRHLAKEKHHILKMMTCNAVGSADKKNSETETTVEVVEKSEVVETAENADESFDWENGSGNWDEPTAK